MKKVEYDRRKDMTKKAYRELQSQWNEHWHYHYENG